ncbi:hypothetical protein O3M35_002445 [Rhynocoris fuscipes]|uniref:Uncharacterized protein n=1 Tax=Rhynocoris fuscipes TaxID=488301 RepID=A0AAW1CKB8_9HEMI
MMRFTPSIPGGRQGMQISSRLTVIATWRTYSTPLYGTSRMTTTKPWQSPPRKPIYTRNAPGTSKKSLGTSLERGGMRCEVCGSGRDTTGHLRIFDRFGRRCFPPGAVGRGDPDKTHWGFLATTCIRESSL